MSSQLLLYRLISYTKRMKKRRILVAKFLGTSSFYIQTTLLFLGSGIAKEQQG
ncbi:hypothetical protein BDW75DRAFT_201373 [Aspergillus navahoensis]